MTDGPFEPPGGQDPDPPNLRLLLRALRDHLHDVSGAVPEFSEIDLRNGALRRAVIRYLKAHFDEED